MTCATPDSALDARRVDAAIVADEPDGRALRAGHRPRLIAHLLDHRDHRVDLRRRSLRASSRPALPFLDFSGPTVRRQHDLARVSATAMISRMSLARAPADRNASAPAARAPRPPPSRRTCAGVRCDRHRHAAPGSEHSASSKSHAARPLGRPRYRSRYRPCTRAARRRALRNMQRIRPCGAPCAASSVTPSPRSTRSPGASSRTVTGNPGARTVSP